VVVVVVFEPAAVVVVVVGRVVVVVVGAVVVVVEPDGPVLVVVGPVVVVVVDPGAGSGPGVVATRARSVSPLTDRPWTTLDGVPLKYCWSFQAAPGKTVKVASLVNIPWPVPEK
jgi:hypothetical protein